ncbi:hypothetical protein FRC04_007114, partial [Tulasnella sp. 424]
MPDLLVLMSTDRETRLTIQSTVLSDFYKLLIQYHLTPDLFRNAMRSSGAVIAGYTALQFFLRAPTGSCSLDLHIANGDEDLFHSLISASGYSRRSKDDENVQFLFHMGRIQFLSQYEHTSGRRINLVIAAEGEASIAPLCTAYSTATLGYITADAIHHLFPSLTSKNKALRLHTGSMCRIPQDAIVSPTSETIPRLHHAREDRDLKSFDVRFNTLPHDSIVPCGLTCPLRTHSFDGMQAFRLVFDSVGPSLAAAVGIDPNLGFKGPNVFFALG